MVARVKMNLDEVELYLNKAESTIIDPGCVTSTSYNSALTGNEQPRKSKVLPNLMVNSNSFYIKLIIIQNTLLILKLTLATQRIKPFVRAFKNVPESGVQKYCEVH